MSKAQDWAEPTADPPESNVFAPLNVGNLDQTKTGALNIGSAASGYQLRVMGSGDYGAQVYSDGITSPVAGWTSGLFVGNNGIVYDHAAALYAESNNFGLVGVSNSSGDESVRAGVLGVIEGELPYINDVSRYGVHGILADANFQGVNYYHSNGLYYTPFVKKAAMAAETSLTNSVGLYAFSAESSGIQAVSQVLNSESDEISRGAIKGTLNFKPNLPSSPGLGYDSIKGHLAYFDSTGNDEAFGVYGETDEIGYGVAGRVIGSNGKAGVYGYAEENEFANIGVRGGVGGSGMLSAALPEMAAGVAGFSSYTNNAPGLGEEDNDYGYNDTTIRNFGVTGRLTGINVAQVDAMEGLVERHNYAGFFQGPLVVSSQYELWAEDEDGNDAYDTGETRYVNFAVDPLDIYGNESDNKSGVVAIGTAAMDFIQRKNYLVSENLSQYRLQGALSVAEDSAKNAIYALVGREDMGVGYCPDGECSPTFGTTGDNEVGFDNTISTSVFDEIPLGRAPMYAINMLTADTGGEIAAMVARHGGNVTGTGKSYGLYAGAGKILDSTPPSQGKVYGVYARTNEAEDQTTGNSYAIYGDATSGLGSGLTKWAGFFDSSIDQAGEIAKVGLRFTNGQIANSRLEIQSQNGDVIATLGIAQNKLVITPGAAGEVVIQGSLRVTGDIINP
ncbi:MAG: hypothetical protein ABIE68_00980 [bacterium]